MRGARALQCAAMTARSAETPTEREPSHLVRNVSQRLRTTTLGSIPQSFPTSGFGRSSEEITVVTERHFAPSS